MSNWCHCTAPQTNLERTRCRECGGSIAAPQPLGACASAVTNPRAWPAATWPRGFPVGPLAQSPEHRAASALNISDVGRKLALESDPAHLELADVPRLVRFLREVIRLHQLDREALVEVLEHIDARLDDVIAGRSPR